MSDSDEDSYLDDAGETSTRDSSSGEESSSGGDDITATTSRGRKGDEDPFHLAHQ